MAATTAKVTQHIEIDFLFFNDLDSFTIWTIIFTVKY